MLNFNLKAIYKGWPIYVQYPPSKGDCSLDDCENHPEGGVDDAGQGHGCQRYCQDAGRES